MLVALVTCALLVALVTHDFEIRVPDLTHFYPGTAYFVRGRCKLQLQRVFFLLIPQSTGKALHYANGDAFGAGSISTPFPGQGLMHVRHTWKV